MSWYLKFSVVLSRASALWLFFCLPEIEQRRIQLATVVVWLHLAVENEFITQNIYKLKLLKYVLFVVVSKQFFTEKCK